MNHRRTTAVLASWIISFAVPVQAQSGESPISPLGSGNVLKLSRNGNYLQLPDQLLRGLNTATLECWVKWDAFNGNQHVFEFDAAKRVKVGNDAGKPDLQFYAAIQVALTQTSTQRASAQAAGLANASAFEFEKCEAAASKTETDDSILQAGALTLKHWHHLAVVFDRGMTPEQLGKLFQAFTQADAKDLSP